MTNSTNSEDEAMPMKIRESDNTDFELMRSTADLENPRQHYRH
jgi:hypothetical protein